jgi:rubrerythrin
MNHPHQPTSIGSNRTGIATSPIDSKKLIEGAEEAVLDPDSAPAAFQALHLELCEGAPPVGSMPPPASIKGAVKMATDALVGEKSAVLLDKLAERLAYERSGVRLYDRLLVKLAASDNPDPTLTPAALQEIRDDELRHAGLLKQAIVKLGGDPTVMTPCADITGVASMGVVQVLTDPRTTLTQCLNAMLTVELADHDAWDLLAALADAMDQEEMALGFREALVEEADHLMKVRAWLERAVFGQAGVDLDASVTD